MNVQLTEWEELVTILVLVADSSTAKETLQGTVTSVAVIIQCHSLPLCQDFNSLKTIWQDTEYMKTIWNSCSSWLHDFWNYSKNMKIVWIWCDDIFHSHESEKHLKMLALQENYLKSFFMETCWKSSWESNWVYLKMMWKLKAHWKWSDTYYHYNYLKGAHEHIQRDGKNELCL